MAEDASLRDSLALERTALANERTLLAYLRTALALVAAGVSSIHFLDGTGPDIAGWFLLAGGVALGILGAERFRRVRRRMPRPAGVISGR